MSAAVKLTDSHCHLDFPELAAERDDVIRRARDAGVGTMLTICTKITEFDTVRRIAQSDPDIWCSVGIHPHEAEAEPDIGVPALVGLAKDSKVIGIGECGLDYYYDQAPRERQQAVFRTHLLAASESGLPVIVHTREADDDTADLLERAVRQGPLSGVLHCFTSSLRLAEQALDLGFFISFSGIVTFKNAASLREVVARVPLDRMLVETDAPFLAPVPCRGRRNEPAFVVHTANIVARIKGVSLDELASATTANFHRLFGKSKIPAT